MRKNMVKKTAKMRQRTPARFGTEESLRLFVAKENALKERSPLMTVIVQAFLWVVILYLCWVCLMGAC